MIIAGFVGIGLIPVICAVCAIVWAIQDHLHR